MRHPPSRLICLVSNRADQMVPWAQPSSIFMRWSLTLSPLRADPWPGPFGTSIGYGRGQKEKYRTRRNNPHPQSHGWALNPSDWRHVNARAIGELSHKFPGSGRASSLKVNICPNHTHAGLYTEGVWSAKTRPGHPTNDVRPCQQWSRAWQWTLTSLQDVFMSVPTSGNSQEAYQLKKRRESHCKSVACKNIKYVV